MVFLAGGVALEKFQGHRRALGDGEDLRYATDLAWFVCGDLEESCAYIAWLRTRTKLLLNQPWNWRAVADLAQALLAHKELSGRAARGIYQAAIDTYGQDDTERAAMDAAVGWGYEAGKGQERGDAEDGADDGEKAAGHERQLPAEGEEGRPTWLRQHCFIQACRVCNRAVRCVGRCDLSAEYRDTKLLRWSGPMHARKRRSHRAPVAGIDCSCLVRRVVQG
jgi:hypothetical protein